MTKEQLEIFSAFKANGYAAWYFPRKKMIRLHGGRLLPISLAIHEMKRMNDKGPEEAYCLAGMGEY